VLWQKLNASNEDMRPIFGDSEIDGERNENSMPNLHSHGRQTIEGFTDIHRIQSELADYLPEGCHQSLASSFLQSLSHELSYTVGDDPR
jgi:hypothetical protein